MICIHGNCSNDCRICYALRVQVPVRRRVRTPDIAPFTELELRWFRHPAVDRRGGPRL